MESPGGKKNGVMRREEEWSHQEERRMESRGGKKNGVTRREEEWSHEEDCDWSGGMGHTRSSGGVQEKVNTDVDKQNKHYKIGKCNKQNQNPI